MKKIKSNKGNTGIEIVISLGIITMTLTILASIYINLYTTNIEIERKTQAINYASQIFEKISESYYSDITEENLEPIVNSSGQNEILGIEIPKAYKIDLNIEKYNENEVGDVVKKIDLTISYNIGKKEQNVKLTRYKAKEILIIPNAPELLEDMIPVTIQKENDKYIYTKIEESNKQWYNYIQKKWAVAIKKDEGQEITEEDVYVWIPRYAYYIDTNTNIIFLYSNKDKTVNKNGNLEDIGTEYITDNKFTGENAKGYWIQKSKIEEDRVANILNESQYGEIMY